MDCKQHKYQWAGPDFAFQCPQCRITELENALRNLRTALLEAKNANLVDYINSVLES